MLIRVTIILIIVTIIPTIPRTVSNIISCTFRVFSIMYHLRIQEVLKCNHLAKGESINYKQSLYEPQNIDRIEKRANPVYGIIGKNLADAIQNRGDYVHYCRTWKPGQAVPEYTA